MRACNRITDTTGYSTPLEGGIAPPILALVPCAGKCALALCTNTFVEGAIRGSAATVPRSMWRTSLWSGLWTGRAKLNRRIGTAKTGLARWVLKAPSSRHCDLLCPLQGSPLGLVYPRRVMRHGHGETMICRCKRCRSYSLVGGAKPERASGLEDYPQYSSTAARRKRVIFTIYPHLRRIRSCGRGEEAPSFKHFTVKYAL
jgi:hypothetical protein